MRTRKAVLAGALIALLFGGCCLFRSSGPDGLTVREDLLDRNEYNLKYNYGRPCRSRVHHHPQHLE